MSLKKQIINYLALNNDLGLNLLFLDEKIKDNVKKKRPQPQIIAVEKEEIPTQTTNNLVNHNVNNEKITKNQAEIKIKEFHETNTQTLNINTKLYQFDSIVNLDDLSKQIANCQNCILGATRTNLVFGDGNPNADIMIIGEAPGSDEDEQGLPFVGRAGKLLTDILKAINMTRTDVYIANICKCRPPANRKPAADEITACEKYLHKQIEIIKPQFILALGLTAADALFKQSHKMADIRGKIFEYRGIKTLITYHPAALLRNPNWKRPVWEDIRYLRAMYDNYLQTK